MTRAGVQRIIRYAFKLAQSRPRKLLTVVTKSNAQRHAMVMWDEIAAEVAAEFPDVKWDKMLVDAMTMRIFRVSSLHYWCGSRALERSSPPCSILRV
jgi:tartrate dehydrogenase/decarboxylase/D-malate dehydrogenase